MSAWICSRRPAHPQLREAFDAALVEGPIGQEQWQSALWVYQQLSAQGRRTSAPSSTRLLIAAAAEGAGIMVVYRDADYDRIAQVTGQPTRWLARAGTLLR